MAAGLIDADSAVRYLNAHPERGPVRSTAETDSRGWAVVDWRVFPFDGLALQFAEGHIHGKPRFVGCPAVPDYYAIQNSGRVTRFRRDQYGRAVRLFAALVQRRTAAREAA